MSAPSICCQSCWEDSLEVRHQNQGSECWRFIQQQQSRQVCAESTYLPPGDSTATSNTGFPESAEDLYKSNAPLRSDEKLLDTFGSFQLNKAIPSETTEELPYADETLSILATLRSTRRKDYAPVALMLQVCDTIRWVTESCHYFVINLISVLQRSRGRCWHSRLKCRNPLFPKS